MAKWNRHSWRGPHRTPGQWIVRTGRPQGGRMLTTPAAPIPGWEDRGLMVGIDPGRTRTNQGGPLDGPERTVARTMRPRAPQATPGSNARNTGLNEQ